jgi:hypothetical protein
VPHVGVSAAVGKGFDKLFPKFEDLKKEYFEVFLPELQDSAKPKEEISLINQ